MKLSECEIGDVIRCWDYEGTYIGCKIHNILIPMYEHGVKRCNGSIRWYSMDDVNVWTLISKKSEKSLEQQIQEKEIELENLKTKLRESNVKKVLDNLDPNTIYKIVHDGFEEVGFVFKGIDNCSIYGINMKPIGTIPTKRISKIFPLKEATETYHKLQLLLKNS